VVVRLRAKLELKSVSKKYLSFLLSFFSFRNVSRKISSDDSFFFQCSNTKRTPLTYFFFPG
jgi:hypothetical protein